MWLRWILVVGWVAAAAAATLWLPSFAAAEANGGVSGLLPPNSRPVRTELAIARTYGLPLLSQDVIVQHRPGGLSPAVTARVVRRAVRLDSHHVAGAGSIVQALPVLDTAGLFPSSRQHGTTALTFLWFRPSVQATTQVSTIQQLARSHISRPGDGYVGATGAFVAEGVQGNDITGTLAIVELAAIGVVFVVVGLAFRSLVAPLVVLAAVGVAYVVSVRVLAEAAISLGFPLPGQLEPLVIILIVGIVTDYSIFFLSAQRAAVVAGHPPRDASRRSAAAVMPLVAVAGVTVAAGTATLSVARLTLYRSLGPGMAICAVVSAVTALTFVPALVAVTGRWLFWPRDPTRRPRVRTRVSRLRRLSAAAVRLESRRWAAAVLLALTVGALALAAAQAGRIRFGLNLVSDLPAHSAPARASAAAAKGFAPGIVAPTVIVVRHHGIAHQGAALAQLQHQLAHQQGVAGVVGPADIPPGVHPGLFVSPTADSARYLLVLDRNPMGAAAVSALHRIRSHLPRLLRTDHLGRSVAVTGDTAVTATLADETRSAVLRVGGAIVLVDLVMLILLLRCLAAPLCLLAGSLLSVLAAIGLTVVTFPSATTVGLTFYVPVAIGVLLASFGSDYNIFLVGRIWEEAGPRRLDRAILAAVPQASSTITRAGVALALTFALLGLVPLRSFRTFAFGMVVGILIDTFVVRSLIVPAVLSLLHRYAGWPNRPLMQRLATARRSRTVSRAAPG